MRDVAKFVRREVLPSSPPHPPRREVSLNPMDARFGCYMKDFEQYNLPMFASLLDVMIVKDFLHRINCILQLSG